VTLFWPILETQNATNLLAADEKNVSAVFFSLVKVTSLNLKTSLIFWRGSLAACAISAGYDLFN